MNFVMARILQSERTTLRPAEFRDFVCITNLSDSGSPERIRALLRQSASWWSTLEYGLAASLALFAMRSLIAIPLLLAVSTARADSLQVSLHHLTGAVYVVEDHEYAKTNSIVYIGPAAVTVVGATWSPAAAKLLAGKIRMITNKPIREVVNNDYNPEYVGGNAYWKSIGAKIISTKLTYGLLKKDWTRVGDFIRNYYPDYPRLPLVLPTVTYSGSFSLQGGRIAALYLGPSHTPDDIFVYFPRERVLYAGGILKEHLGNMAFANIGEYERTLHKLQKLHLDIVTIISGHWSAVHGLGLINRYLAMLKNYSENER